MIFDVEEDESYQSWVLKGFIIATQHLTRVYLVFKIRECKILGPISSDIFCDSTKNRSSVQGKFVSLFRLNGWLLNILTFL